jgi:hypothetical protein
MVRTQVQLSEVQARALRTRARSRGVSQAELIRQFIDRGLAGEKESLDLLFERAARVIGKFKDKSGVRDLAENHDRYLNEAGRW